ncbi:MAG: hypothetical protein KDK99_11470 [Verrucomicrobiales bacterium]|nr:hypothetical protein [Verrucomicrobiales bacterium]
MRVVSFLSVLRASSVGLMVAFSLGSCETARPTPAKKAVSEKKPQWQRETGARPYEVLLAHYGTKQQVDEMAAELGDRQRGRRGTVRLGNGTVSVGFRSGKGRRLPVVECGGRLLVVGEPGQEFQIEVVNELGTALEVMPRVDGEDLEARDAASWEAAGVVVPAHGRHVFAERRTQEGRAERLKFGTSQGVETLHLLPFAGTVGKVAVAVFLPGEDVPKSLTQPRRPRAQAVWKPHSGTPPNQASTPFLIPYQFR